MSYTPTPEETEARLAILRAKEQLIKNEARKMQAEAEREEFLAQNARIDYEQAAEAHRRELAADSYHHIYRFLDTVNAQSVRACIQALTYWERCDPGCAFTILFNSPGGSIIDGMHLFDTILDLRKKGHFVTTMTRGYAASMAGILLQAGDKRIIGPESYILIHEAAFAAVGKVGEVEDTLELVHKMQDRVLDIFASRAQGTGRSTALTRNQFKRRWRRKDWWISSPEAYKYGIVDEIG